MPSSQLSLTNPRDAHAWQKLLKFDVKTSCRQVKNLLAVMEIRCLVIKFLIQITSVYTLITIVILVFFSYRNTMEL